MVITHLSLLFTTMQELVMRVCTAEEICRSLCAHNLKVIGWACELTLQAMMCIFACIYMYIQETLIIN